MDDLSVREGGRLSFTIKRADPTAISVTFVASNAQNSISDTVEYDIEGLAYFEFGSPDTDVVGEYEYHVRENFLSGSPDIYPNNDDCDGDCGLPILEICRVNPEGS